jgi:arylsulfatase A-like enzyme
MTGARSILLALILCSLAKAQPDSHPNLLFFLIDDLGWADLGCYGSTFHETPAIDQLARESLRFTQAYTAASLCSPTRASLMTGKHPVRVNITDWIPGRGDRGEQLKTPEDRHALPLEELTLGEAFQQQGYDTFYIGKWHLGPPDFGPDKQGFDKYVHTVHRFNGGRRAWRAPPDGERRHLTQFITRETIDYLQHRSGDSPFFAYVSYHDVHTPVLPDKRFVDHFAERHQQLGLPAPSHRTHQPKGHGVQSNAKYASMVRAIDESVDEILACLDESQLADDTLVVFMSDNGGLLGPTSNAPLRSGKGWLYEGGIRVPMLVRTPQRYRAGETTDVLVTSTDLYPTLLSLAGLELRSAQHVDALDFSSLFTEGDHPIHKGPVFWHFPHYHGSDWTPGAAVRDGDWKLIEFYEHESHELCNLAADPTESENLSESDRSKATELLNKLHTWQRQMGAQLPTVRHVGER